MWEEPDPSYPGASDTRPSVTASEPKAGSYGELLVLAAVPAAAALAYALAMYALVAVGDDDVGAGLIGVFWGALLGNGVTAGMEELGGGAAAFTGRARIVPLLWPLLATIALVTVPRARGYLRHWRTIFIGAAASAFAWLAASIVASSITLEDGDAVLQIMLSSGIRPIVAVFLGGGVWLLAALMVRQAPARRYVLAFTGISAALGLVVAGVALVDADQPSVASAIGSLQFVWVGPTVVLLGAAWIAGLALRLDIGLGGPAAELMQQELGVDVLDGMLAEEQIGFLEASSQSPSLWLLPLALFVGTFAYGWLGHPARDVAAFRRELTWFAGLSAAALLALRPLATFQAQFDGDMGAFGGPFDGSLAVTNTGWPLTVVVPLLVFSALAGAGMIARAQHDGNSWANVSELAAATTDSPLVRSAQGYGQRVRSWLQSDPTEAGSPRSRQAPPGTSDSGASSPPTGSASPPGPDAHAHNQQADGPSPPTNPESGTPPAGPQHAASPTASPDPDGHAAAQSGPRFCPACGIRLGTQRFCGSCGTQIRA